MKSRSMPGPSRQAPSNTLGHGAFASQGVGCGEPDAGIIDKGKPVLPHGRMAMMAKVELHKPGSRRHSVKWWEWLVFAAVLEVYLPRNQGQKMGLWDWVVLCTVVSSAFL